MPNACSSPISTYRLTSTYRRFGDTSCRHTDQVLIFL
jgi:hypothetical protein